MEFAYTLAYYDTATIMALKVLIVQAHGVEVYCLQVKSHRVREKERRRWRVEESVRWNWGHCHKTFVLSVNYEFLFKA
jgi:hypothetical protein